METNNFKINLPVLFLGLLLCFSACKEREKAPVKPIDPENPKTYGSPQEFYNANEMRPEYFSIDASSGGSFTTAKGTKVTIHPNSLTDEAGNPVTGSVDVEFKDIYRKSDMLLSGMPTMMVDGQPLKSGGEFFIRIVQDGKSLIPGNGKPVVVELPLNGEPLDEGMIPFVFDEGVDSMTKGEGWWPSPEDSLRATVGAYILSLYQFSIPASGGTWCNSDNAEYFAAYPQSTLTIDPAINPADYKMDVFLAFKGINSMIHVYQNTSDGPFPYHYAPVGLPCTVIAIGAKEGKLYSSFTDITISANQSVNVSLQETTDAELKNKLETLNN